MKTATLKQAAKILSLFEEMPSEQIQAILESGFLADLRDGNIANINRDAFRKFIGLNPLTLPSLTIGVLPRKLEAPYDGWELVENVESPAGTLELCLAEFLESGESYVKGEVMRERAKKHNWVLGEMHVRALLEAQDRIPEEWRKFRLVFLGTIWRSPAGYSYVSCLCWDGECWYLHWHYLENCCDSNYRFVRLYE